MANGRDQLHFFDLFSTLPITKTNIILLLNAVEIISARGRSKLLFHKCVNKEKYIEKKCMELRIIRLHKLLYHPKLYDGRVKANPFTYFDRLLAYKLFISFSTPQLFSRVE